MCGDDGLVDAIDMLHEIFDFRAILFRQAVSRRVRDIDHCCPRFDDCLDDPCEVFIVGASCILGIKLHILHIFLGITHCCHGALYDFLSVGVEFINDMWVAGTDAGMNAFMLRILQ